MNFGISAELTFCGGRWEFDTFASGADRSNEVIKERNNVALMRGDDGKFRVIAMCFGAAVCVCACAIVFYIGVLHTGLYFLHDLYRPAGISAKI